MTEAWIQLTCPDCRKDWEANPSRLPNPGASFACPDCEAQHPLSEFTRTKRDFEIVDQFHE